MKRRMKRRMRMMKRWMKRRRWMIKRRRMVKRRWRSRGGDEEDEKDEEQVEEARRRMKRRMRRTTPHYNQSFRPVTAAALCLGPPAASSHLVSLEGNRQTCGASLSSCSTPPPPA